MAASCVNMFLKSPSFVRNVASHRLLYQSGLPVVAMVHRLYSNSISNDNMLSNHPDIHEDHFRYDTSSSLDPLIETCIERGIGRTLNEQHSKYSLKPDQPIDAKVLRFSIIGIPNSGKSTLTNQLMNWKVSPVSSKVHTTRKNTVAAMTEKNSQIVFVDTPGVVTSQSRLKHKLEAQMVSAPSESLQATDMIGVIVDASNQWQNKELGQNILQLLHLNSHLPSILILNKVDLVSQKNSLLEITRLLTDDHVGGVRTQVHTKKSKKMTKKALYSKYNLRVSDTGTKDNQYRTIPVSPSSQTLHPVSEVRSPKQAMTEGKENEVETWQMYHARMQAIRQKLKDKKGWPKFDRVFMISALNGDGITQLRDYLLSQALPGNWEFHSSFVTDQDPLLLAKDLLWEKLLEMLPEEVPYKIRIETEMWEVNHNDVLMIALNVVCKKKKHLHMIVGSKGKNIRSASEVARQAMMDAFRVDVQLKVNVKLQDYVG